MMAQASRKLSGMHLQQLMEYGGYDCLDNVNGKVTHSQLTRGFPMPNQQHEKQDVEMEVDVDGNFVTSEFNA